MKSSKQSASLTAAPPPVAVVEIAANHHKAQDLPVSSPQASPASSETKKIKECGSRLVSSASFDSNSTMPSTSIDSSSTTPTIRTAEEIWFEEYCDAGEDVSPSSKTNHGTEAGASSPLQGRKTIDVPKPIRRHRRNNSAVPRLQTSPGELPPLPPGKRPSLNAPLRKHALSWDSAAFNKAKPTHRRTASSSNIDVSNLFSPLDALVGKLEKMQQQFGKQDSRVATVWNMIGNAKAREGDNEAAVEAYKAAVKCEPGPHLADSYGNLGTVFFAMNKLDEAVRMFACAREVMEYNVLSEGKDPSRCLKIASVQYQLGLAQTMLKNYHDAWMNLKRCASTRASVLGEKHKDTAKCLDAIGKVYLLQGNHRAAVACHEEALSIKKSLSVDNATKARLILVSLQNIAAVHKASKDSNAAVMAYGAVLGAQKKQISTGLASAKAEAAETLVHLADLFEQRNMKSKAVSCLQEADALLEEMGFSKGSPLRAAVTQRIPGN